MATARDATPEDFDKKAQEYANNFWLWAIASGTTYYFLHWWCLIPATFALLTIAYSVSSTKMADKLRKGTYPIPSPNNDTDSINTSEQSTSAEAEDAMKEVEAMMLETEGVLAEADSLAGELKGLSTEEHAWMEWFMSLPEEHKQVVESCRQKGVDINKGNFESILAKLSE